MQYKVIPFAASISRAEGANAAASQLQTLIAQQAGEGWEYVRLESVETYVVGSKGCIGIGATPGVMTSYSMVVFKK